MQCLEVTLCDEQFAFAVNVGIARELYARTKRYRDAFVNGREIDPHVLGAIGEYVVSKFLGVYWDPAIGDLDDGNGDVAGYEVKCTVSERGYLRVKEHNNVARTYVLVTFMNNDRHRFAIRGCMPGVEVKDMTRRYFNSAARTFEVPQRDLHRFPP
jgi:hypothetical protein